MTTQDDEITQLRAELASIRSELASMKGAGPRPIPAGRISRAGLLRAAGLAAAGAAAGAAALPSATPALADNGSNLIAGQDNQATATTSLTGSVLTDAALRVSNYYTGAIDDYSDALQAYTYGAGLAALYGRNDATGGSGVIGYSGGGVGGTFAGGTAPIRLQPASRSGAPTSVNHQQGELYVDANGSLWLCTAAGSSTSPGTFVQLANTAQLPPSLAASPDFPPANPTAWDDEFNATSLDPKWALSTSDAQPTAYSLDFGVKHPSYIWTTWTGNCDIYLTQQFNPAPSLGTYFSATMKGTIFPRTNYRGIHLRIQDSGGANWVNLCAEFTGGANSSGVSVDWAYQNNGSATWNQNNLNVPWPGWPGQFYLHIQRDENNNYTFWFSHDGLTFMPLGSNNGSAYTYAGRNATFTPTQLTLIFLSSGSTNDEEAGIDWVRVNWRRM